MAMRFAPRTRTASVDDAGALGATVTDRRLPDLQWRSAHSSESGQVENPVAELRPADLYPAASIRQAELKRNIALRH